MNEMAQAFKVLKHLPKNEIIQYPSGRWGFCGSVDIDLSHERKDGLPLTEKDVHDIQQFGTTYLSHIKSRSFATREEAAQRIQKGLKQ